MGATLLAVATVPGGECNRDESPFDELQILGGISGNTRPAHHHLPGAILITAHTLKAHRDRVTLDRVG